MTPQEIRKKARHFLAWRARQRDVYDEMTDEPETPAFVRRYAASVTRHNKTLVPTEHWAATEAASLDKGMAREAATRKRSVFDLRR